MKTFKPPEVLPARGSSGIIPMSVFLAGSIGGNDNLTELAADWQDDLSKFFSESGQVDALFNPRRDDWDSTWKQSIDDPRFAEQVNWEMDALEAAQTIVMYFDPKTKAPISLLELGLHAKEGKVLVICPDGFWRKGNVEVVCKRLDIPLYNSIEDFKEDFKSYLLSVKIASSF